MPPTQKQKHTCQRYRRAQLASSANVDEPYNRLIIRDLSLPPTRSFISFTFFFFLSFFCFANVRNSHFSFFACLTHSLAPCNMTICTPSEQSKREIMTCVRRRTTFPSHPPTFLITAAHFSSPATRPTGGMQHGTAMPPVPLTTTPVVAVHHLASNKAAIFRVVIAPPSSVAFPSFSDLFKLISH